MHLVSVDLIPTDTLSKLALFLILFVHFEITLAIVTIRRRLRIDLNIIFEKTFNDFLHFFLTFEYSKKNLRHFNFKDFYKSETEEVLMGKKQIVQLGKIAKMS